MRQLVSANSFRSARGLLFSLAFITTIATVGAFAPSAVALQEKSDVVEDTLPDKKPPAKVAPAGDQADPEVPPPAVSSPEEAAPPEKASTPVAAPRQSYLAWLYDSLGALYSIIFLSLSFALVAVFVMNALAARREFILPSQLIEGFEAQLNAKNYQGAFEMAKGDESFLGKVLSAGLARISSGYPQAIEAMQEVGEEENMRLDHRLSYLALIGTISPMFGLLGTVDGMVKAFNVIAQSQVSPKPSELAGGISTALVTTLVGLWLAIPAIAAFNILRNRVARLVLEVGIASENLMSRFQNVGPQKQ
ncbi:MAG: MotA/TolQ/ExbB proton channel family protein [Pirellulales bacterium]|nr:MotA/TolQ/ExbB proton channel family protein [Pirellulales bacterium]